MKLNLLTLKFSGDSSTLEEPFLGDYCRGSLFHIRISLVLGALLYAAFGSLDAVLMPEHKSTAWLIRFVIVCPALLGTLLTSFSKSFERYMQPLLMGNLILAGGGIVCMIVIAPETVGYSYYAGLMLVFMWGYTFLRVRFLWASLAGWVQVVLYEVTAIWISPMPFSVLLSNNFFFISANVIGMLACYSIEFYARRDFFLTQQLEMEREKIIRVNQELEEHVEKRTADYRIVNRTLEREIIERKQSEEVLRESEERYRALVDNASDIVFTTDNTGHFTFVNPAGIRIVGYGKEEIIGRHYPTLIRPDKREEAMRFFGIQFVKGLQNTYSEYPVIVKEGGEIWLAQNTKLIVKGGHVEGFHAIARDITALKRIEEELRRNQEIAERLAQEIAIIAEIGKVVGSTLDTKEVYERFAAEVRKLIPFDRLAVNLHDLDQGIVRPVYVSGEYVAGRQLGDAFPLKGSVSEVLVRTRAGMFSHPMSVEEMDKRFPQHTATIKAGMRSLLSVPLISRDEVIASLHFRSRKPNAYTEQDLRLAERIGEQIAGAIANAQLYAGQKKAEKELKESEQRYRDLSIIDDLTQLYNSRHFYFQLKIELDRSNRYEQPLTLLLLDLDNFKHFNDTYGHVEGDQVLMRLGQVVKRCLRETDFAYRYGGEEFTILLPMTTSADGAVTAERIRTEFKKETFSPAPGQDVHVTVSIGLAQYKPQEEMKTFVHRVDQLMYQGKKNGKDRVCSES